MHHTILLDTELAQRWQLSAKTLQSWRSKQTDPKFIKLEIDLSVTGWARMFCAYASKSYRAMRRCKPTCLCGKRPAPISWITRVLDTFRK